MVRGRDIGQGAVFDAGSKKPVARGPMSLRAEIVRVGMRSVLKARGRPNETVTQKRQRLAMAGRLLAPTPAAAYTFIIDAGGVAAERIIPQAAPYDRYLVYLHGGGFIAGSPNVYRHLAWRIALAAGAQVLAPDYRLAPEYPFPAALDDAVAAYRWLLGEGVAPRQVALVGDSAGGGLAFSLLLRLRDEGRPLPAAVAALSPWTDLALTGASLRRNARADPMLDVAELAPVARSYLAGADPRHPWASPIYGELSGMPPALIQVGSDEILHDDAARLAERLAAAGSTARLEIWPRMPHVWHLFAPMLPEARRAIGRIGSFLCEQL
jgi:epsilon-lactone hydrolase